MLHVYVDCYFSVNSHIYRCICLFMFYICMLLQEFHVHMYFNCMQLEKLCGIAQLVVGYAIVCSAKRTRVFLWCSVARPGWPGMLQCVPTRLLISLISS
jgi:hypothetical protein